MVELEAGLRWASASAVQGGGSANVSVHLPSLFCGSQQGFKLAAAGRSAGCFLRRTVFHKAPPSYSGCALEAVLK